MFAYSMRNVTISSVKLGCLNSHKSYIVWHFYITSMTLKCFMSQVDSLGEVIKMKFEMTEGVEEVKEIEMSWDPDLKDQNIITKITDSYEGGDHCIKDSDEEISRKRREEGRIRHGDETDNENSQGILDACSYDVILVK